MKVPRPAKKFRQLRTRVRRAVSHERRARWQHDPIIEGQVLYEAYFGGGVLCSPEAIFRELLAAPDLQHLTHVWVLADLERHPRVLAEFADDPKVRFVRYKSDGYFHALSTSQYLVNNSTFPPEFSKREGQTYLNTWHGTPLKHMGYDVPNGATGTRNVIRNFAHTDFLLSTSEFMTQTMYLDGYKLRGIYRGAIIQEGSPRVDRQTLSPDEADDLRRTLAESGYELAAEDKLLLYAPTWQGDYYRPQNDVAELAARVRALAARIDPSWRVGLKVHQRVYDYARAEPSLAGLLLPDDVPTNAMLGLSEAVVTDYSSIFYDFLPTGRPVFFLAPDAHAYEQGRGLYAPMSSWPGPVCGTIEELADRINALGTGSVLDPQVSHRASYEAARRTYAGQDDGHAGSRIVDVVFRGRRTGYDVREGRSDGRTSVLIYLGGMLSNGITQSALNLLNSIDHGRYDVSVLYQHTTQTEKLRNIRAINPGVRHFPRIGGMNHSRRHRRGLRNLAEVGVDGPGVNVQTQQEIVRQEWVRCFGASQFDHVVDFSGYSAHWAFLLLASGSPSTSVFLHNDLLAETRKEINGRRPHEKRLPALFTLYDRVDHLVSVSPALAEVNRSNLAQFADPEKFVAAPNTIDHRRILRLAWGLAEDNASLFLPELQTSLRARGRAAVRPEMFSLPMDAADLPGAIRELMRTHSIGAIQREAGRQALVDRVLPPVPGMRTFVTAGRLSPEKNHERLIRAFDLVHRSDPLTRLVIMGTGVLERSLKQLTRELGLHGVVRFTGQVSNPFAIMAHADCFVLSSDYEGQPMVILEARIVGLPVVTTAFPSVAGALPDDAGLITELTAESLAEGMQVFLAGGLRAQEFDYLAYNAEVAGQFFRAIGAGPTPEPETVQPAATVSEVSEVAEVSLRHVA